MNDLLYTRHHNCYSYALNEITETDWLKQQPGVKAGLPLVYINTPEMNGKNIRERILADYPNLKEIPLEDDLTSGEYKFALFTAEGSDYHLYKYVDGVWKHKLGPGPIQILPAGASPRDHLYEFNGRIYDNFVTCFKFKSGLKTSP